MEEEWILTWWGLLLSSSNACQHLGRCWSTEIFWLRLANSFNFRRL